MNEGSTAEKGAAVRHPIHGEGRVSTLSPGGQYATVRYPAGYIRTHRLADLTRVTPPGDPA
jgi:hypothetical protein